jgi:two-component system, OmpR family, sensor histidine kinase VanS
MHSKKITLFESYRHINSIYNGNPEEISLELEKYESTKGLRIVIFDDAMKIKYVFNQRVLDSSGRRNGPRMPFNGMDLKDILAKAKTEQIKQGSPIIEASTDNRLNTNFISLFSKMDNGDFIVLNTSVSAIQESVKIANKFYLFTGLLTIVLGCIFVFFITGRFTEPILELNNITKGMAKLDFTKRYSVKSMDEIGQLGESINSLSEQLEKSISELWLANEKLQEDIDRERKIDEMRKGFISNVSHELKSPISLIQGYAEGLKVNVNEDEENKNFYCDTIMNEAQKMNKLVRQLLELSKLESGMIVLDKSKFHISELINCVLKKNSIVIKEKCIDVSIDKFEDLLVIADFDRSEQVLTNFINNAIDHVDGKKVLKLSVNKFNEKVKLSVFNTGQHIAEEEMNKIWLSFYKVDKARSRDFGGTGLGLSIVRAIQEAHNNSCGVNNVEDGVEFWFELDTISQ